MQAKQEILLKEARAIVHKALQIEEAAGENDLSIPSLLEVKKLYPSLTNSNLNEYGIVFHG